MAFMRELACGVYLRISQDRPGSQLGVERQRKDCEDLAAQLGWRVVERYVDNDVSAYSGRERPAWNRLVDGLRAGKLQALVAWHPDRLYRRMTDLEALVELVEAHGLALATVQAGDVELSSTQGRLVARLAGAVAAHESEHKSERIVRKHRELAEAGRWKGGPRPYGYRSLGDGRLEVVAEEAKVIKDAAERVFVGQRIHAICAELNQAGVPTAKGGEWRPATLHRILTQPGIAGQREYHGKVVSEAAWEPIVDEVTLARLKATLTGPSRTAPARVSWLNGLLVCRVCAKPLHSMRRDTGSASMRVLPDQPMVVAAAYKRKQLPSIASSPKRCSSRSTHRCWPQERQGDNLLPVPKWTLAGSRPSLPSWPPLGPRAPSPRSNGKRRERCSSAASMRLGLLKWPEQHHRSSCHTRVRASCGPHGRTYLWTSAVRSRER